MSYSASTLVACERIQGQLNKLAKVPDFEMLVVPSPLTEYLMSPVNRGSLIQEVSDNGKIKTVRAIYGQRSTGGGAQRNQANPRCTATGFETNAFVDYTIDPTQNSQSTRTFQLSDLIYNCEKNEDYMARVLLKMINEVDQDLYEKHATEAYALAGEWGTDVEGVTADQLIVKTQKDSSIDPYPNTFQEIEIAAMQSAYQMPYTIFGGTTLWSYANRVAQGCCAASGLDIGGLYNTFKKAVAYDRYVQEAMGGQSYNLMVGNGALQVLSYNAFKGANGINFFNITPTDSQRVITSHNSGIEMDLLINYDCGVINMILTATTKVVGLPNDLFANDDIYAGVKFVNEVKVTNV